MSKKDSPRLRRRCKINGKPTVAVKPARKTRSRTRKPKYLSLRLQLSPEKTHQQSRKMTKATARSATNNHHHPHQQLNLFPLHPENLVEEKDNQDENMAYFFDSADGGATTLTTLFGARSSSSSEEDNSLSPSLTHAYGEQCSEEGALVRTAMRNKERDASEERWVCYSEVVERKDEEVTSCAGADDYLKSKSQNQRLSLKLDYEEILNAWSDKGPLYIQLEFPQTVPDLSREFFFHESSKGVQDGWGSSNGGLWTVPENSNFSSGWKLAKVKEEAVQLGVGGGEEWKVGQREASVLRYKEKRQNRLFSKRIRYEVRKINAEKRPRIKGRFVKRG